MLSYSQIRSESYRANGSLLLEASRGSSKTPIQDDPKPANERVSHVECQCRLNSKLSSGSNASTKVGKARAKSKAAPGARRSADVRS